VDLPRISPAFGRHEFVIRRLHSLLGVAPLGAYLVFHLATNASVIDGLVTYQRRADQIHVLGESTVVLIGWLFILLPILFHGIVGLLIVTLGKRNLRSYTYRENFRYTLERYTGVLTFVFVIGHVFHMTGGIQTAWWVNNVARPLGGAQFVPENVITGVEAVRASPWITTIYVIGTLAAVYHFANGLWTAGITWGVWSSAGAQRWANVPCLIIGLGTAGLGAATLVGMYEVPLPSTPKIALGGGLILVGLLLPRRRIEEQRPSESRGQAPSGVSGR
jgi:succinate dehydrogenase / fumarate reductase, cytochrome b subunit